MYLGSDDIKSTGDGSTPSCLPLDHRWGSRYDDPDGLLFAASSPRCRLSAWFEAELDKINLASLEECERERRRLANSVTIDPALLPDLIDLDLMGGIPIKPGTSTLARLMGDIMARLAQVGEVANAKTLGRPSQLPILPRVLSAGGQTRLYAPLA